MRTAVLCLLSIVYVKCQQPSDDLYILIDEVSVYSCRGVKNEVKLTEDDVDIVNEKGNKVHYIHAPGNYSLHFRKISVTKDFGFLAGEIGVTLQVPIIEGPAGMRFDLPYTMIPETGLLSSTCDANSGIVERDGRQYCRYCDLCGVGSAVESELQQGSGHKFLLGDGAQTERCGAVSEGQYEFKRTISLPGRSHLERLIKEKATGVEDEIKKRLNKGRGRFQVFLNLIAAARPSIPQKTWMAGSEECRACNSFYCSMEECKSAWAQQCLHNTARIAACYTVEFNYRMTASRYDVSDFLRENGYPDQDTAPAQPQRRPDLPSKAPSSSSSSSSSSLSLSEQCVQRMPQKLTHLRRYCTIFWNAKLCCTHCDGVC